MSIQRILTNRAYIGLREMGVKKGCVEVVKASWPAIIDLEIFNKVQERLAKNRNRFKPDEWKRYPYPLTEILVCGDCGKPLGGKSAHGKNSKHFYYSHPRQIHSDGVTHLKRCQVESVRAGRIEEVVLKSLKDLAKNPDLIDEWLEIYAKGKQTALPGLNGRLKTIQVEIQSMDRRLENLAARLADIPKEVSAEPIYRQMKALSKNLFNSKLQRQSLNFSKIKSLQRPFTVTV